MSFTIKRLLLLGCSVLSILALGSGVASAAGKPTSVQVASTHELAGYTVLEFNAKVNPNGASTSATIELREEGAAPWVSGETHTLSGTTIKNYSEELYVKPLTNYEVRVTATNLYGSTVSSVGHGYSSRIRTTGEKELTSVPYVSTGTASIAFTYASLPVNVDCTESSSGQIGTAGGAGDLYKFSLSSCVVYVNGTKSTCQLSKGLTFNLGGPTLAVQGIGYIPLTFSGAGCSFEGSTLKLTTDPFRVVDNGNAGEYGTKRSVSVTATAHMGSGPAEVTIESGWQLAEKYVGTPFKITDTGL